MLKTLRTRIFRSDRRGATAIEYGLIAAGVAVAIMAGVASTGNGISGTFCDVAQGLGSSPSDCSNSSSGSSGSSSSSSGSSSSGGDTPTPTNATIATCAASGGAWDGTCVDPSTLTAAVTSFCNSSFDSQGRELSCAPDGSSSTIAAVMDDAHTTWSVTQTNCESLGGVYGTQPAPSWSPDPNQPTCALSGASNTPYNLACLNLGWGVSADGTCGPSVGTPSNYAATLGNWESSALNGMNGLLSATLAPNNCPGKTCWAGSFSTTIDSQGNTVLVVSEPQ